MRFKLLIKAIDWKDDAIVARWESFKNMEIEPACKYTIEKTKEYLYNNGIVEKGFFSLKTEEGIEVFSGTISQELIALENKEALSQ